MLRQNKKLRWCIFKFLIFLHMIFRIVFQNSLKCIENFRTPPRTTLSITLSISKILKTKCRLHRNKTTHKSKTIPNGSALAAITGMTNQQLIDFLREAARSDLVTHCEISRDEPQPLPLSSLSLARNNARRCIVRNVYSAAIFAIYGDYHH